MGSEMCIRDRLIQSTAVELGWKTRHLDYDQAFLNAPLDRFINVSFPHNLPPDMKNEMCYQLTEALYGLRQAPLCWFTTLRDCLLHKLKFTQLSDDGPIFVKKGPQETFDDTVVVLIYVDNIQVCSGNDEIIEKTTFELLQCFEGCNEDDLAWYLGCDL